VTRPIVDVTMYAYEPSALRVRLESLRGVVDHHLIVSGDRTYRGKTQIVTLPEGIDRANVTHAIVELPAEDVQEKVGLTSAERSQREQAIELAIGMFGRDALILFSDCDEIPHPEQLRIARDEYGSQGPRVMVTDPRCWFADWSASPNGVPPRHHLNQPIIGTALDYELAGGGQDARTARGFDVRGIERVRVGQRWFLVDGPTGWHFSNLDGPRMVSDKFAMFGHSENDNEHDRSLDFLEDCLRRRVWPIHEWPLHATEDVPACIPEMFPELLGGPRV